MGRAAKRAPGLIPMATPERPVITRRQFMQTLPAGLMLGTALPASLVQAAAADQPISIAFPVDVSSWDPTSRVAPNAVPIFKCVFDQPLEYSPDSQLGPNVVKQYRWLDDKGLALELELRDDVLFHNGDALTSADFRFTFFERPKADKTLQLGAIWRGIQEIETPTPHKAIIRFSTPMVSAPQFLGYAGAFILPKAYFEKVGLDGFLKQPIGSGPYRVVEYQRDSRIVLQAFDRYWRGKPKISNVTFQIVKEPTSRIAAIQSRRVNVTSNLPVREAQRLGKTANLVSTLTPTVDTFLIHMVNTGALTDRNVRVAMHHAIDKAALSRAFFSDIAAPLSTAAPPGTPAYAPEYKFAYSTEKARQLLADSGYGQGKPVRIRFFATNGVYPNDFEIARAIVQMWKAVGIEAELQVIELAEYYSKVMAGKLEGPALWFWTNATGDPELSAGSYLNPKAPFSVWRSSDVSARLDPLLVQLDYDARIKGYKEFHVWAVEQGYSLPLLQGVSTVVYTRSPGGYAPFRNGWVLPYYWNPT